MFIVSEGPLCRNKEREGYYKYVSTQEMSCWMHVPTFHRSRGIKRAQGTYIYITSIIGLLDALSIVQKNSWEYLGDVCCTVGEGCSLQAEDGEELQLTKINSAFCGQPSFPGLESEATDKSSTEVIWMAYCEMEISYIYIYMCKNGLV